MSKPAKKTPEAATKIQSKRDFKKRNAKTLTNLKKAVKLLETEEYAPPQEISYRLVKIVNGAEDAASSFEFNKTTFDMLNDFRGIAEAQCCSLTTPIEEFIIGLHCHNQMALTPELIQQDLDIAKLDFNDMTHCSKKFISQYPDLFTPNTEEAS